MKRHNAQQLLCMKKRLAQSFTTNNDDMELADELGNVCLYVDLSSDFPVYF